jgi:hypothetical protein
VTGGTFLTYFPSSQISICKFETFEEMVGVLRRYWRLPASRHKKMLYETTYKRNSSGRREFSVAEMFAE